MGGDPIADWLGYGLRRHGRVKIVGFRDAPIRAPPTTKTPSATTNEQYGKFLTETGHVVPESFTHQRFNDPTQPVVAVNWEDARAFMAWLTGKLAGIEARLPTEAEWEYAARGTDGQRYPWGNEPPDATRARFAQPIDSGWPSVVGHTPRGVSPFGVHDLAGNVWEWCLDAWARDSRSTRAR